MKETWKNGRRTAWALYWSVNVPIEKGRKAGEV
jgi:hypothetical protein